jgi:mono/diheme cytochrome c family protein
MPRVTPSPHPLRPGILLLLLPVLSLCPLPANPAAPQDPAAPAPGGAIEGRKLFIKNCAPCHGPDGTARTPAARKLGVKDLTVNRLTDDKIRHQIREGVQAGSGSGKMPGFKDAFTEADLTALVAEVKRLRR